MNGRATRNAVNFGSIFHGEDQSSEGYKAKADAEKAVATIKAGAAKAEVVEVKE